MKTIQAVFLCLFVMQITANEHPAFYAVQQKDTFHLRRILAKNSESITVNENEQTILHTAVLANNLQAVNIILNAGFININQLDKDGKTAMDYAVEYGHNKIVKKLYKKKGKATSVENAKEAKKIITQRLKNLFEIGISIFFITILPFLIITIGLGLKEGLWCTAICMFYPPYAALTLVTMSTFLIGTATGIGYKYRSNKNLLLDASYLTA